MTLNEEQARKMKEKQARKTKEDIKRKRRAALARSGLLWTVEKYKHLCVGQKCHCQVRLLVHGGAALHPAQQTPALPPQDLIPRSPQEGDHMRPIPGDGGTEVGSGF